MIFLETENGEVHCGAPRCQSSIRRKQSSSA